MAVDLHRGLSLLPLTFICGLLRHLGAVISGKPGMAMAWVALGAIALNCFGLLLLDGFQLWPGLVLCGFASALATWAAGLTIVPGAGLVFRALLMAGTIVSAISSVRLLPGGEISGIVGFQVSVALAALLLRFDAGSCLLAEPDSGNAPFRPSGAFLLIALHGLNLGSVVGNAPFSQFLALLMIGLWVYTYALSTYQRDRERLNSDLRGTVVYSVLLFMGLAFCVLFLDRLVPLLADEGGTVSYFGLALLCALGLVTGLEPKCHSLSLRAVLSRASRVIEALEVLSPHIMKILSPSDLGALVCGVLSEKLGGAACELYAGDGEFTLLARVSGDAGRKPNHGNGSGGSAVSADGSGFDDSCDGSLLRLQENLDGSLMTVDHSTSAALRFSSKFFSNPQDFGHVASDSGNSDFCRTAMELPLMMGEKRVGSLIVDTGTSSDEPFGRAMNTLASQVSAALSNALLVEGLEDANARLSNALQDLEGAQLKLIKAEKMAALGRLSASVAHEIRNPLGTIKVSAVTIGQSYEDNHPFRELTDFIVREVNRLNGVVGDLLEYSKPKKLNASEVDISVVIARGVASLRAFADERGVRIAVRTGDCRILGDAERLQQIIINLLANGIDACRDSGAVAIISLNTDTGCEVWVMDNGRGISRDNAGSVFEPFFTTKNRGNGLGLAITQQIVEAHGGHIDVVFDERAIPESLRTFFNEVSTQPHGAVFRVELPFHTTDSMGR
ncbi:MAG: hypothetical protein CVV64_02160 [Candidatus Wallbacteria bacterium HGW-Wallbacteria-1]|jgi:signal transduction histidine kinase|uniref:histidine kinase n=1 Tax=Candidatus Wallbacteria bacterium HGW-Wallbacteria-1 TaxID=2013854 RepID=A0A2N1PVA6_9BACT|nr:MAG: hypothetical protein CVV64_02160 [Candidatus Wallbacteria bacterium HGW-Wallbacteria-1]